MGRMRTWVGLFGNVALVRGRCDGCGETAIILDGQFQCCGAPGRAPEGFKQECAPELERKLPPKSARDVVLKEQGNRCLYCEREFGRAYFDGGKGKLLRPEWDHFVPYSYRPDNSTANFVAACKRCNMVKASKMFATVDEARAYIASREAA